MKIRWIFIALIIGIILIIMAISASRDTKQEVASQTSQVVSDTEKKTGASKESASALYAQANGLLEKGEYLKAKEMFKKIITDFPNSRNLAEVEKKLEDLNMRIIFSRMPVEGRTVIYKVKKGDTLEGISKRYKTTVNLIKRANGLTSDIIRVGQQLRIWTQKFSCVVDKSQNILILKAGEEVVKTYTVSTGLDNSTPVGTFKIVNKLINPVWYKAGAIVLPDSPDNILGSRWLGLDVVGYGIHGTTQPESIGQQITQGCVRMRNHDVEELYDLLPVGTEVTIVD
jgi:lipoprotein-anchoring transpeptidase ErfK/SrfK